MVMSQSPSVQGSGHMRLELILKFGQHEEQCYWTTYM